MPLSTTSTLTLAAATAQADQDAALRRVAQRILDEIAQRALEQRRIRRDEDVARPDPQVEFLRAAFGAYSVASRSSIAPSETISAAGSIAPASSLEMSRMAVRRPFNPPSAFFIIATVCVALASARDLLLDQRHEQDERLHRLAQVVAGGGQELGLGEVRPFGLGLGEGERLAALDDRGKVLSQGVFGLTAQTRFGTRGLQRDRQFLRSFLNASVEILVRGDQTQVGPEHAHDAPAGVEQLNPAERGGDRKGDQGRVQ